MTIGVLIAIVGGKFVAAEIERRWPGSLRLFAPSETTAARG